MGSSSVLDYAFAVSKILGLDNCGHSSLSASCMPGPSCVLFYSHKHEIALPDEEIEIHTG